MYSVNNLTANSKQKHTITLPDGSQIKLSIFFVSMQMGWFIKELSYKKFTVHGMRICNSPNLLHQFRNQIPFGLMVTTEGGREPSQQNDLAPGGLTKLYILTPEEVQIYTELLTGEV